MSKEKFLGQGDLLNKKGPVSNTTTSNKLPYINKAKDHKLNRFARFRRVHNINAKSKDTNNDLIIIEGCVESDKNLRILIDNGSQVNIIANQVAIELGKNIRESNTKLSTVSSEMTVMGEVDLNISIAGHSSSLVAQVVNELSPKYDVILGMPWLNDQKTKFETCPGQTPIFKIGCSEIPIIREAISNKEFTSINVTNLSNNTIDFAKCANNLKVLPRSVGFLKLKIPYNSKLLDTNQLIHFEQMLHSTNSYDEYGDNVGPQNLFKIQSGVIKVKLSGNQKLYCHVPYSNLSEEAVFFKNSV